MELNVARILTDYRTKVLTETGAEWYHPDNATAFYNAARLLTNYRRKVLDESGAHWYHPENAIAFS